MCAIHVYRGAFVANVLLPMLYNIVSVLLYNMETDV